MSSRVLIAGCGYVGATLARMLVGDGDTVFALTRKGRTDIAGATSLRADLAAPETLDVLPARLDAVVFTAGSDESTDDAYRKIYVEGLRNLVQQAHKSSPGLERLIVTTSTGVYGQDAGESVDETSETSPTRFSGRRLLECEAIAAQAPCDPVIVRFGGIYGPGRTRFFERVRNGQSTPTESPAYTNRIHRDDCAGVLRHLLRFDGPDRVYLGVDHEAADRNEVIRWIADRLGVATPAPAAAPPTSASGKRCSNRLLLSTGYEFLYPTFREGYGEMIDASRQHTPNETFE